MNKYSEMSDYLKKAIEESISRSLEIAKMAIQYDQQAHDRAWNGGISNA